MPRQVGPRNRESGHADEGAHRAPALPDPHVRQDLVKLERSWFTLAGGYNFAARLSVFFSNIKPAIDWFSSEAIEAAESPSAQPAPQSNAARRGQRADAPAGRASQSEQRQPCAKPAKEPSILSRLLLIVSLALCPTLAAHAVNDFLQYRERQQAVRNAALATAELRNSELE